MRSLCSVRRVLMTILGMAALLMVGCGDKSDSVGKDAAVSLQCVQGGDDSFGIRAGKVVGRNAPMARGLVWVVQKYKDQNGKNQIEGCTGSLVDSNIVLTAAHCVNKATEPTSVAVVFSSQPVCDLESSSAPVSKANSLVIHDSYQAGEMKNKNDIALIRLESQAPSDHQYVKLSAYHPHLNAGSSVALAGYGVTTDYTEEDAAPVVLRHTQVKPISSLRMIEEWKSRMQLRGYRDYDMTNSARSEFLFFDQSKGTGACVGDSGGPALLRGFDGQFYQIGVASFVFNPNGGYCKYGVAYTNISAYADWIRAKHQGLRDSRSTRAGGIFVTNPEGRF